MDLARYVVEAVLTEGRSVRAVASATGCSKSWMHRRVTRFREEGEDGLVPRRRGPALAPNQTPADVEDAVVGIRKALVDEGLDAGAATTAVFLGRAGILVPGRATIHRILVRRGLVVPQPQKRPRSSWQRFEAALPNECWQSDMTHWHLRSGRHVEIVTFLDDYSRVVVACEAMAVATAAEASSSSSLHSGSPSSSASPITPGHRASSSASHARL
jgi:transposase InsO family protein